MNHIVLSSKPSTMSIFSRHFLSRCVPDFIEDTAGTGCSKILLFFIFLARFSSILQPRPRRHLPAIGRQKVANKRSRLYTRTVFTTYLLIYCSHFLARDGLQIQWIRKKHNFSGTPCRKNYHDVTYTTNKKTCGCWTRLQV